MKTNKRYFFKSILFFLSSFLLPIFNKLKSHNLTQFEIDTGFRSYGEPSRFVKIFRWIVSNSDLKGNGTSYTPLSKLEGSIVPNGLHFERHHHGVKSIEPDKYSLLIDGDLKKNKILSLDNLYAHKMYTKKTFIECGGNSNRMFDASPAQIPVDTIHGLISFSEWTGVRLKDIFQSLQINNPSKSNWLEFTSYDDGKYNISIPLKEAIKSGFLALYQNGEPIRPEQGYPVRLIIPGWEGSTHVKWVEKITIRNSPVYSRNETSRYTDLLKDGKAKQFSFLMKPKSIILSPSPGIRVLKGENLITGLAWSGSSKIKSVEFSTNSGKSWKPCEFETEQLNDNCVRFRANFIWDGSQMIIQSRCVDVNNYVQPSRNELLNGLSKASYYHFNGITSWKIKKDGSVINVYL